MLQLETLSAARRRRNAAAWADFARVVNDAGRKMREAIEVFAGSLDEVRRTTQRAAINRQHFANRGR